jgi:hypothetical protein
MQKSYIISCCAECPAFGKKNNLCRKVERITDCEFGMAGAAILGFPEWCPLPDTEIAGDGMNTKFKRIARQILKRLELGLDDDSVTSVAHYLSTVVNIKDPDGIKTEPGGLFEVPAI